MGGGPPCFTPDFPCPVLLWCHPVFGRFRVQDFYLLRFAFPGSFRYPLPTLWMVRNPTPQCGLGSSPFARRYSGNRCFFLFLRLLRCFSSPGCLLMSYGFTHGFLHITAEGFPHSDICGSTVVCTSPQLFAACHVLLRLLLPRHPPYALCFLTFSRSYSFSALFLFGKDFGKDFVFS